MASIIEDNKSLASVLGLALEAHSTDLRVALPGKITAFDATTGMASVQPLSTKRRIGEEQASALPVIPKVPVIYPRTDAGTLFIPVNVGDAVTLLFSDRSLNEWKLSAGATPVEANILRFHNLADCWAILGGYPEGNKPTLPYGKDVLQIALKTGTKVAIGDGTNELLTILHELLDYIETKITFSNAGGPTGPPPNFALVSAIRVKLETLKVT